MVSNTKISRALGVSKMCVTGWRERGCPNSSVRAAKKWALENATNFRMRSERDFEARVQASLYRSPSVFRSAHR
jgi:hypothetical protein